MELRITADTSDSADALRALMKAIPAVVSQTTMEAAHLAELAAKNWLRKSSHPKGTVTPAQAGEPPSLVTGALFRSIRVTGPILAPGTVASAVGPTIKYGRIQELGGKTGRGLKTTLPKRPYMKPSTLEALPDIEANYRLQWGRLVRDV